MSHSSCPSPNDALKGLVLKHPLVHFAVLFPWASRGRGFPLSTGFAHIKPSGRGATIVTSASWLAPGHTVPDVCATSAAGSARPDR